MDEETIIYLMTSICRVMDKRYDTSTYVYRGGDNSGGGIRSVYMDTVDLGGLNPRTRLPFSSNFEMMYDEIEETASDHTLGNLIDRFYKEFKTQNDIARNQNG